MARLIDTSAEREASSRLRGAVVGLTRAMALDHAGDNIRVNCIMPGLMWTPRLAQGSAAAREMRRTSTPLPTEGQSWDIGWAAVYLASDEAKFVTGGDLAGGRRVPAHQRTELTLRLRVLATAGRTNHVRVEPYGRLRTGLSNHRRLVGALRLAQGQRIILLTITSAPIRCEPPRARARAQRYTSIRYTRAAVSWNIDARSEAE